MYRAFGKSAAIERNGGCSSLTANPTSICHPRRTTITRADALCTDGAASGFAAVAYDGVMA
jgi:hypothetical protein